MELVQPAELIAKPETESTLLDVRPPEMVAAGAISGAVNIPLGQLRDRIEEVPSERPVTVYCKMGQTSYMAARILEGLGRSGVRSLNGGYDLYRELVDSAKP